MSDTDEIQLKELKVRRRAARAAVKSGNRDGARSLYLALATDYADNKAIFDDALVVLAHLGFVDDVVGILEDALKQTGERLSLISRLAQTLIAAQRWTEAGAALQRQLALGWNTNTAVALGHSLAMSDALDEAEAVLQKAIAADPAAAAAHVQLATVHIKRGKAMDALAAADTALACAAKPSIHCLRGEILLAMGQPILAAMAFQRALDMAPDYPPALAGLAETKARQPQRPRVMAYGQRVLVQNPADGGAQYLAASWTSKTEFRR